ncbi:MAG: FAD-dependent monooxygenase [Flavobacteriaceae bacterium]|nr:FAD-dependent monooxygenase [Flavobacteriaceae bacterium]
MDKKQKILIIGAGLSGSLLALRLAKKGYLIDLRESRKDLRITNISAGKSINLAFSDRGIKALALAGIMDQVMKICIPMKGRLIHNLDSSVFFSPYSGRGDKHINSISRGDLNAILMNEAEKLPNLTITFESECKKVNLKKNTAHFYNAKTEITEKVKAAIIFGADGAGSALRKSMFLQREILFSFSQQWLKHGYKELSFPAANNGGFLTEKNALHIWPRGTYMLIALPNIDGTFTVTLFLPHSDAKYSFETLNTSDKVLQFFKEQFPDALEIMPNLVEEFNTNPVGALGTIKCSPYSYKGKTLLIGDAAHAVVPFYGQGMNASFEDVTVLFKYIDKYENKALNNAEIWSKIFYEYEKERKKDADAIGDLAVENYFEMRDHVANDLFKKKRALEMKLEDAYPDRYFSKYSRVTFNDSMPYSVAKKIGNAQDKAFLNLIEDDVINENTSVKELFDKVKQKTDEIIA